MKIICIGSNYAAHIEELSNERTDEPVVFIKPDSAVLPKEQDFFIPEFSREPLRGGASGQDQKGGETH